MNAFNSMPKYLVVFALWLAGGALFAQQMEERNVAIEWSSGTPTGRVVVDRGSLKSLRVAAGTGDADNSGRFTARRAGPFRLEAVSAGNAEPLNAAATLVEVESGKSSFTFLLRDARREYPIWLPGAGIAVTVAADSRTAVEIGLAGQNNAGRRGFELGGMVRVVQKQYLPQAVDGCAQIEAEGAGAGIAHERGPLEAAYVGVAAVDLRDTVEETAVVAFEHAYFISAQAAGGVALAHARGEEDVPVIANDGGRRARPPFRDVLVRLEHDIESFEPTADFVNVHRWSLEFRNEYEVT